MTATVGWENFYVIVGSSAGALIGLQFVVITIIATMPISDGVAQASSAFASPNVVHFGSALLLSALLCAPWHGIHAVSVLWGLVGLFGLLYAIIVARRMRRQSAYHPDLDDWLYYALLPIAAYALLVISAILAFFQHVRDALFLTAAAALLLLFLGIRNAWDSISYHVFTVQRKRGLARAPEHMAKSPSNE